MRGPFWRTRQRNLSGWLPFEPLQLPWLRPLPVFLPRRWPAPVLFSLYINIKKVFSKHFLNSRTAVQNSENPYISKHDDKHITVSAAGVRMLCIQSKICISMFIDPPSFSLCHSEYVSSEGSTAFQSAEKLRQRPK